MKGASVKKVGYRVPRDMLATYPRNREAWLRLFDELDRQNAAELSGTVTVARAEPTTKHFVAVDGGVLVTWPTFLRDVGRQNAAELSGNVTGWWRS